MRLSDDQKAAQATFRAFADEYVRPRAAEHDRTERFTTELISRLAEAGYLGGSALDAVTFGLLNEVLGNACTATHNLVTVQSMVAHTIARWGTKEQRRTWLPAMASGDVVAAVAVTEPAVGSDAARVETRATPGNGGYVLEGHKKWTTFGQLASLFLVLCQVDGKPTAVLVERDTPGLRVTPMTGLLGCRGSMIAEIHLEGCRVGAEALVGAPGFGFAPVIVSALETGRYCVAWGCVGLVQACLDACMSYASTRRQFGSTLEKHPLIRSKITDMVVGVRAARLLCLQAGQLRAEGDPQSVAETMAAKYYASTLATRSARDAVQIHGANGSSPDYPVERLLRDATIQEIIEGTTQIHQLKIAELAFEGWRGR